MLINRDRHYTCYTKIIKIFILSICYLTKAYVKNAVDHYKSTIVFVLKIC